MIRELPVDTSRINLVATGHVIPVMPWVSDPANPGRNMPGTDQSRDEVTGLLLWTVDALAEDMERGEVIGVQVGAAHQPVVERYKPVNFIGLSVRVSVDRRTNQVRQYWAASGISEMGKTSVPSPTSTTSTSKPSFETPKAS